MSTRIVAVTNNKGGVGKTHTVFHLAGAYAEQGKRVLVLDLDSQQNLTSLFSDKQARPTVFDVLAGTDLPLLDVVLDTRFPGIHIAPADPRMEKLDAHLLLEPDGPVRLADALQEYVEQHGSGPDYILIDCPPSLSMPTRNALAAAHHVVIPLQADDFSVQGLDRLLDAIAGARRNQNPQLSIAGVLMSMYDTRRSVQRAYDQAIRKRDLPVLTTRIKTSAKYQEAIVERRPITHYRPKSAQAEAFRQLARELEEAYVREVAY